MSGDEKAAHHEKHTWFVASSSIRPQQYGWTERTTKRKGNGILHRGIYNGEEFQQSQRVRAWSKIGEKSEEIWNMRQEEKKLLKTPNLGLYALDDLP